MQARFPRPTASHPFYSKPHVRTKLLPVVQLRSGVIVLMGDPASLHFEKPFLSAKKQPGATACYINPEGGFE